MNDVFKKLKNRFVLTCLLTGGVLLLLILMVILGVMFNNYEMQINRSVEQGLFDKQQFPSEFKARCITILVNDDSVRSIGTDIYSTEAASEIVSLSQSVQKGEFTVGNNYFAVNYSVKPDGATIYAVYDYTRDRANLINNAGIFALAYLASLALIVIISYLLANPAIKPVKDAFIKQKELVANASHELKTPLTIISTNLAVVESNPQSTVQSNQKWLDNIDSYCDRMDKLILDMLELSRLESPQSEIKEQVVLSELTNSTLLSFEAICYDKNITLKSDVSANLTINGSKKSMERLLLILLDNAVKYTEKQGEIYLNLSEAGKKIQLSVKNSGSGISQEDADKIFDRFYRVDKARGSESHSFGLGLSIAKAIVENLKGSITVNSSLGQYTQFVVTLPKN